MRRTITRLAGALAAVATIATPVKGWAGDYCATYGQVASHATGGDWVGGLLIYETTGHVTRTDATTTTTVTTTINAVSPTMNGGGSVTTTVASAGGSVTTDEPIGFYAMNDGSTYEINCATGESRRV